MVSTTLTTRFEASRLLRGYEARLAGTTQLIVLPYGRQADSAVTAVKGHWPGERDIIAQLTALHSSHIADIISRVSGLPAKKQEKALVVYDSMWGSTDKIYGRFLAEGIPAQLID